MLWRLPGAAAGCILTHFSIANVAARGVYAASPFASLRVNRSAFAGLDAEAD